MNPPDWTTLRIFLAAVELGSVTRAADTCGIAVSAATKRIQDLEVELGVRLFDRAARGVTPTAAGELVARHARSLWDLSSRLGDDVRALAGGGLGSVRLNASLSAIAGHPLAEAIAKFTAHYPRIRIELQELPSLTILQNLVDGRSDIGIITIQRAVPEGLAARLWQYDRLLVVVPADHEVAGREAIRFSEVLDYPMIGVLEQGALTLLLEEAAERLGRKPRYSFRVSTGDSAARLAAADNGVTVMPDGVLSVYNPDLRLVGVPLAEPWSYRQLRLVSRPPAVLPPSARLLLDYLAPPGSDSEAGFVEEGFDSASG